MTGVIAIARCKTLLTPFYNCGTIFWHGRNSFYLRDQYKMHVTQSFSHLFLLFFLSVSVSHGQPPASLHEPWNELLHKYVGASGQVNYRGIMNDRSRFDAYLKSLSAHAPAATWSESEKLAYWINAYNAFTVKTILDHYPVKSILDIDGGKVWNTMFISIGGKMYSLDQIEQDIIRKQFNEPRIHFALNCASASCPKMLNEAYTAEKLNAQLTQAAKGFINDPSRNKISATSIQISKVFDWYQGDFTKKGTLIDFLNQYSSVKISAQAPIKYLEYDWSLNE